MPDRPDAALFTTRPDAATDREAPGWLRVAVHGVGAETAPDIVANLIAAGAGGVQEQDDARGRALVTFLHEDADLSAVRRAVDRAGPGVRLECEALGAVDWSARWVPDVGVQRVGRITIAPPWLADEAGDPARAVLIEPAMAFGTGEHPTTRGVVRLMQDVIRPGDSVADLGAGSAVLSVAAVRLGASRVFAVEMDPDAIANAEANVARNGVADRVAVLLGDAATLLPIVAPVRVVLANIISSVLVELAPVVRAALSPGGRAVLSGILHGEREHLLDVLGADGWSVEAEDREGEWWSTVIAPR